MFLTEFTENTEEGESRVDMVCKFFVPRKNLQTIFPLPVISVISGSFHERVRNDLESD